MTTANDIIKAAFRIGGVTFKGETPDADETQDALNSLNDLLESLSNDSLYIYGRVTESFSITGGQISYTIGSGGDFDTARPTDIISAYVRSGTIDYDMDIISGDQYSAITSKSITGIPSALYYEASFPLGTIKLYSAPTSGYTLFMLSEKPLTTVTLNQTLSLPPGWNRFLKNQLAIEISAEYGQQPPELAFVNAREAKGLIKRAVSKQKSLDVQSSGSYDNIYTGWNN